MKIILALAFAIVVFIVGYIWLTPGIDWTQRHSVVGAIEPIRPIILFVMTIAGIVAKNASDLLEGRQTIDNLKSFLSSVFRSATTIRSLLISPIVFFVSYKLASSQPDDLISILLAFENGFFWQAIFEKRASAAQ